MNAFGFQCLRPQSSREQVTTPRGSVIVGKSPALNAVGSLAAMPRAPANFGAVGPVASRLSLGFCNGPQLRPASRGPSGVAAAFGVFGDIGSIVGCRKSPRVQDEAAIRAACAAFRVERVDPEKTEYATDVLKRLLADETSYLPGDYMSRQAEVNTKMRSILIDWLIEVHMKYRMTWDTLFLTVNIIDRYLSVRPVQRKKLQLLGVVAMFVAAKCEEIDPPRVQEFAYITDHTCSKKEIIEFEARALMALNFEVVVPTPAHFLEAYATANACDDKQKSAVRYILELSLLDLKSLHYQPSVLVAAAILLSNELLAKGAAWSGALAQQTGRSEKELRPCVADLRRMVQGAKASQWQAVQRKYKLDQHHKVTEVMP